MSERVSNEASYPTSGDETDLDRCEFCGNGMDARWKHPPPGGPVECRTSWRKAYAEWSKRQTAENGRPEYRR